jgi:tripartite-type tricarboxylate transporter receptor subunit TctC
MNAILALAAGLAAWLIASPAAPQIGYPDHPIRFIVGFTPGSATDITARLFAQKFNTAWHVPVTVENVPGGGGSVGGERVSKALPDGATFYWGANGALTINPTLQSKPTYDVVRDLAPVARIVTTSSLLVVNNEVQAKTLAELIALAKAEPGKFAYATPGVGTPQHVAGELLKSLAQIDIVHVPYRGSRHEVMH